jgi:hypothetical protein
MDHIRIRSIATFAVLGLLIPGSGSRADVLYKKNKPVGIGHGSVKGKSIQWQFCDERTQTFAKPPYSVYQRAHCNLTLATFGLAPKGQLLRVADVSTFSHFFPDAQLGAAAMLSKVDGLVKVEYDGRAFELPLNGEVTGHTDLQNTLSLAVGFKNLGAKQEMFDAIQDARQILSSNQESDLFPSKKAASIAAKLISELSFAPSPIKGEAHLLFVDLATYRSQHTEIPAGLPPLDGTGVPLVKAGPGMKLDHVDFFNLAPNEPAIELGPGYESTLTNTEFNKGIIQGGSQVLDSIRWSNATFVNTRIIYHGGPVYLENVKFLHCTFEISIGKAGDSVLRFASIDPTDVSTQVHGQSSGF